MNYSIKPDNLDHLDLYWHNNTLGLNWPAVFVLPPWLNSWWQVFGGNEEIYLRAVYQDANIIGIAPLRKKGNTVFFIGDIDVCDYVDFIVTPDRELEFFSTFMDDIEKNGIRQLDLKYVRPDSTVMQGLVPYVIEHGYQCVTTSEDVNVEMDLPSSWDEYLALLSSKQRHEVKRKLRRLGEAGNVEYHINEDEVSVSGIMGIFFRMFVESRQDKATFLTEQRESFFRLLASNLTKAGLLRFGILNLDGKPVAQILYFDYNDCVYLYNSGYDPEYVSLSAGLLSKVLAIKDSIEKGKRKFDFLKGPEIYKYHLGGREVPLYRCLITLEK